MDNLHIEVKNLINEMCAKSNMFTVYDITRILRNKKDPNINHEEVKKWVEWYFFNGGAFYDTYTRTVGNHLNFKPLNPQIYHNTSHNHLAYDPNALAPYIIQPKTKNPPKKLVSVEAVPVNTKLYKVYIYAAKVKGKDIWLVSKEKNKQGRVTSVAEAGLYKNKNGPVQLINREKTPSAYEVVKYSLSFMPEV